MKFRHAAALALVGWYLMVPPQNAHWQEKRQPLYNSNAPLSEWDIDESFDTAAECQAALKKLFDEGIEVSNRIFKETHDDDRARM